MIDGENQSVLPLTCTRKSTKGSLDLLSLCSVTVAPACCTNTEPLLTWLLSPVPAASPPAPAPPPAPPPPAASPAAADPAAAVAAVAVPVPDSVSRMQADGAGPKACVAPAGSSTRCSRNSGMGGLYSTVCLSMASPVSTSGAPVLHQQIVVASTHTPRQRHTHTHAAVTPKHL